MDANDIKIRKQWLAVFFLNMVQTAVWQFLMFVYNPLVGGMISYIAMFSGLLSAFGVSYAMYACAYKKPGVKLLTVFLVLCFAGLLATPILLFTGRMDPPFYIPFYMGMQALSYLIAICWTVACWRLRKVNRKLCMAKSP